MRRNELAQFGRAVVKYQQTSHLPPLDPNQVDPAETDPDWRALLARRGFRSSAEQYERTAEQERFGFKVRLDIEDLDPTWNDARQAAAFDPTYDDSKVFLKIRCVPIGTHFLPLAKTGQYRPDSPYHISLCYTNDLHRFNLYDFMRGLRRGKDVCDRVRNRYNGKIAHLRGRIRTGSVAIEAQTVVYEEDGRRTRLRLHADKDVLALIAAGKYSRDVMHMTL